jgi:hypothetical protein
MTFARRHWMHLAVIGFALLLLEAGRCFGSICRCVPEDRVWAENSQTQNLLGWAGDTLNWQTNGCACGCTQVFPGVRVCC